VQRGGFSDADGVIVHRQSGRTLEGQRSAAGTRCNHYRLSGSQFAGHRFAKRLGAIGRSDDIDQFGVLQGLVDIVTRIGNLAEPGDVAFCVDSALLGNRRDVAGKLLEIE
jgi:hypothetical protein